MGVAAVFCGLLLVGVVLSDLVRRSMLSMAVLFLAGGIVIGPVLRLSSLSPTDPLLHHVTELALFAVLFSDGMRVDLSRREGSWQVPARALLLGVPITVVLGAIAGTTFTTLGWAEAALVAAVLAPTDPVFASAIVGREGVPARLRRLLNIESGLNDGLALPIVIVLIEINTDEPVRVLTLVADIAFGLAIGVVVPALTLWLERSRLPSVSDVYGVLNGLAIGALVFTVSSLTGANLFVAAFVAGIVIGRRSDHVVTSFERIGEPISEVLKVLAVFLFGMLLHASLFRTLSWGSVALIAVFLFAIRPLALGISLAGTGIPRDEFAVAAWFGPRGFASVVYGLLVLGSTTDQAGLDFSIIAATIAASIVLHSSTDVPISKYFERKEA